MVFAPKFEVIDLSSNRVDTQDIVSFYDGDPLLLQITGYDTPVVILLADRAQGRISDETLQEYEYKKFPDRDGLVLLEPELIDRVKDGLTYYFTVRSYHVIQGNGYWFTRRNGRVENRAAIRNDKEGPPFAPRVLEQTSATVEPSGEGVQAVTLKRPVVSAKPMVDPDKGIVLTAITLDGEDVRSQVSEGVLNVQQTGQMQSVSWTYTATNILGDTPSDGMIGVPAYAKPVASNALPDLTFEDESGLHYAQTAQDFTGLYLAYSLQSPVPGVSINEGTGRLTIDLDGAAISSRSVVVVATNGAGSASSAFTLTVTAPSVDLLEATAERNATDPRLVDYAIAGVPEGYGVRLYVGTEEGGDFDLAEPITEGGTTGSNFAGLTYVWVYIVNQDSPNSPLASGLVATLDPYAPTVAAANVSARRNEAEPERVDMTNGTDGQILPPGYAIEVYVGTDEAGDSGATTVIPEGETIPTSPTHAGLRYVVAFLRDDVGQIVDSELVATLPSIENPTVANANLSAARNADSPGWVDFVNGADDQLMPSTYSVGFYAGDLPEGDPQFVTVVPEGGTATSGKEFPNADYVVGFIFDGPNGTGNVVDSALVVQLAAVGGSAVTITQTRSPTVSPATEGQTARSRYNPGAYKASDGSTVTVAKQMLVGGSPVADGYILAAGDVLAVQETVTAGGVSQTSPVSASITVDALALAPTTTTDTVRLTSWDADFGETATLSAAMEVGTYIDGSPFVVGPAQVDNFSTPSANTPRTFDPAASGDLAGQTSATRIAHGTELNPGNAGSLVTLADKHSQNMGVNSYTGGVQGYDELILKSNWAPYEDSKNIDPGITGSPINLTEGTLVKSVSFTTADNLGDDGRPTLDLAMAMTVVAEKPFDRSFRPGFSSPNKASPFTEGDMDLSVLPNFDVSSVADRPNIDGLISDMSALRTHQGTYGPNQENYEAGNRIREGLSYMGTMMKITSQAIFWACTNACTLEQKRQIYFRLIQHAIDIKERAEAGGIWYSNGGHSHGRKMILAAAKAVLRTTFFDNAMALTQEATYNGSTIGQPIFADDNLYTYIDQTHIDAAAGRVWDDALGADNRDLSIPARMLGWPDSFGETERNPNIGNALGNVDSKIGSGIGKELSYVNIQMESVVPFVLASHLMPRLKRDIHPALFDYADRYMDLHNFGPSDRNSNLTGSFFTDRRVSGGVIEAWKIYEGDGRIWDPLNATEFRLVSQVIEGGNVQMTFNRTPITVTSPEEGYTVQGRTVTITGSIENIVVLDADGNELSLSVDEGRNDGAEGGGVAPDLDPGPVVKPPSTEGPFVFKVVGQSQNEYIYALGAYYNRYIPKPQLKNDVNMIVYHDPHGTDEDVGNPEITATPVTQENINNESVNIAQGVMGEFLAFRHPGRQFVSVDGNVPGTGFPPLMDDSNLDRLWSDMRAMIDRVEADGYVINDLIWSWMGDDATYAQTWRESFQGLFTGVRADGQPLQLGEVNPDDKLGRVADHIIYDMTVPDDQQGRGEYPKSVTMNFAGWFVMNTGSGDTDAFNYTERSVRDAQVDRPARQLVRDFLADPLMDPVRGWHGPSPHSVNMGYGTHPVNDDPDGIIEAVWPFAVIASRRAGDMACQAFTIISAERDVDGTSIRHRIGDTDGGNLRSTDYLMTLASFEGDAAPSPLPPHFQDVLGFEIVRANGTRRPVYHLNSGPDFPDEYKGTVTIDGEYVVVTPLIPFADDEYCDFLRGDAGVNSAEQRDAPLRLHRWNLRVHRPELYQADATYPLRGIAVDPQPPLAILRGEGVFKPGPAPEPTPTPSDWALYDNGDGTATVQVGDEADGPTLIDNGNLTATYQE